MPGIRPLLKLSYTLNAISGLGAAGFHAVNLACHAAATLLAAALCRRLAAAASALAPVAKPVALTAGLLFALHPAQTEAVTYISGRSVSLMAALYLGAVVAHLAAADRPRLHPVPPLLFGLALASKETAATLPLALVLAARAEGATWREAWRRSCPCWAVLAGAIALAAATPGYRTLIAYSVGIRGVAESALTQINGIWYLLTQPLLLLRSNIDPPLTAQSALTAPLAGKAAVLLGLLAVGPLLLWRTGRDPRTFGVRPLAGIAVVWFFLHLAPTNSLLPRLDVANDRQLYLALLGPAGLLAAAIWSWLPRRPAIVVAAVVALGLAGATVVRNEDYRSEIGLWTATLRQSPGSGRAWNNLGYAYQQAGRGEEAHDAYTRALALDPGLYRAYWNREALQEAAGRRARAARWGGLDPAGP